MTAATTAAAAGDKLHQKLPVKKLPLSALDVYASSIPGDVAGGRGGGSGTQQVENLRRSGGAFSSSLSFFLFGPW